MASSLLAQIANPTVANIPQAFMAGQTAAGQRNLLEQQALNQAALNPLQQQLLTEQIAGTQLANRATEATLTPEALAQQRATSQLEQSILGQEALAGQIKAQAAQAELSEAETTAQRSEVARNLLLAQTSGPGQARTNILNSLLTTPNLEASTQETVLNLLRMPEGVQEEAFTNMVSYFRQAGYLPETDTGGKTPEQIQQALNIEQGTLEARQAELKLSQDRLKAQISGELQDSVSLSTLGKQMNEMDNLDPNDPYYEWKRQAYEDTINDYVGNLSDIELKAQAEDQALQIVQGRLDPDIVSKRQGLQSLVFSTVEKKYPGTNLTQLAANAKFTKSAGNLQSLALINGVQPLMGALLETGKALNNTSYPLFNKLLNKARLETGKPNITAFNNLRDDLIAESERILMGSGVLSDSKYLRALDNVNSAQSYPQLKAAIDNLGYVIQSRHHALLEQPYLGASPSSGLADQEVAERAAAVEAANADLATETVAPVSTTTQEDPLGIR